MDTLLYHPTLTHTLRFLNTTPGRDKLLRLLQYLSRFLTFYLLRTGSSSATITPLTSLATHFSLTRKLLRLGKNLEHFKEAYRLSCTKSLDSFQRYCAIGRQLSYGTYLSFDALAYLHASGIHKLEPQKANKIMRNAQRAWLTGIVFGIVGGWYSLYGLGGVSRKGWTKLDRMLPEGKVEEVRSEREKAETKLQLVSDCCDFLLPAGALGIVSVDDGVAGLAGVVSSLIGMRAAWRKTATASAGGD